MNSVFNVKCRENFIINTANYNDICDFRQMIRRRWRYTIYCIVTRVRQSLCKFVLTSSVVEYYNIKDRPKKINYKELVHGYEGVYTFLRAADLHIL